MKYGALVKKVSFKGEPEPGSSKKKGGGKTDNGKKPTKTRCPEWQVTKKGKTIKHEGCKYVWCTKHTSKDGSINGLYMPSPHDHDKWTKAKRLLRSRSAKRTPKSLAINLLPLPRSPRPRTSSSRLAASSPLRWSLTATWDRPRWRTCLTPSTMRPPSRRKTDGTGDGQ